jgi:hypothetical protein
MSKKKRPPFKIILDAPAMRDRLHELTGNELKVWMYLWLRTGKEETSFPSNQTIADDIGIHRNSVKAAKRGLRAKCWSIRIKQRKRDNGSFSTVVEQTITPWDKTATTDAQQLVHGTVAQKADDGKLCQPEVVFKDLEVSASPNTENLEEENQLASELVSSSLRSSGSTSSNLLESQEKQTPDHGVVPESKAKPDKPFWLASSLKKYPPAYDGDCGPCPIYDMIHEVFGCNFTIDHLVIRELQNHADYNGWDVGMLKSCIHWATKHKFWGNRIVSAKALLKAFNRSLDEDVDEETTLIAQYKRYLAKVGGGGETIVSGREVGTAVGVTHG